MNKKITFFMLIGTGLGLGLTGAAIADGPECTGKMMHKHAASGGFQNTSFLVSGDKVYKPGLIKTGMTMAGDQHKSMMSHSKNSADIVDTAVAAGSFNTLVSAVKAADLVETLKGEGPFTVFAPTDAAFAKIPPDALNALLSDKAALTKVLTYHVVPGKVTAKDVMSLSSAKTVEGQSIEIDTGNGVQVNNAKVIKTDIATSNGVIHVIDAVMLPPDLMASL